MGTTFTGKVPFYRHDLGEPELAMVAEVLRQNILTTGDYVTEMERRLAAYLGIKHALGVTSCTGAMHMALVGLGIGPGDEVITTPMTFIATATAIIEAGATPVFVDVEPGTGNLDAERVESAITPRTKAIIPVHLYGHMCDMRRLHQIADRHNLRLIEDAAHCVEGMRDGIRPGQLSDAVCFSFYATKNLSCGEGGGIACTDDDLYQRLRLIRVHGMTKTAADRAREGYQHWDMTMLGWKYNMSNIEAAILLPQFDRLDSKWESRRQLADRYRQGLSGLDAIDIPTDSVGPGNRHALHLFPIRTKDVDRDQLIARLIEAEVEVVVNYRAIHLLSYFRDTFGYERGAYPIAESIGDRTVSLPFYPGMPTDKVDAVIERLAQAVADL